MSKILEFVLKHHLIFIFASFAFAGIFLLAAPFVKTVDNIDYFTLENSPEQKTYDHLKEVFGNDEFFVIAFKKENIFTTANLTLLQQVTREIASIDEVREVKSLTNVDDTIGEEQYFEVRKFIENIPVSDAELKELKKNALDNPLYINNLISEDGRTAAIIVFTYQRDEDEFYRKNLITKCNRVLEKYAGASNGKQHTEFWTAGYTITNLYLSQYLKDDIKIFIPLAYILITLCVHAIFRNARLTLLAVVNISVCVGSTMGLFYFSGIRLNNVTSIVPPLIMALALCDTVHIFSHMDKNILHRAHDKTKALVHVLKAVFMPCFLATVTTAVGFLSLYISEIPPIREFALMASAGMVFKLLFSFILLPPLILLFDPDKVFMEYNEKKWQNAVLNAINRFNRKYAAIIVIASFTIVCLSLWSASGIRAETNLVDFFKEKSPVRVSLSKIEENLSGVGTLDISIESEDTDAFKIPENIQVIEKIQTFLKQQNGVDAVNSFADFIKDINMSFHNEDKAYYTIPQSRQLISQYMLIYDSEDIDDFINESFNHARIAIRTHLYNSGDQKKLIDKIKAFTAAIDEKDLKISISGRVVNDVTTIDALVQGQFKSMCIATAIILLVMFFVLGSFKTGLLSIVPNLFPIIINFGIMGFFDVPLNTATALISSVALGIAVDDTIHFLYEFKKQNRTGRNASTAIDRIMMRKGRAIMTSSFILSIGFGVMVFSKFMPIVSFGVLSAIIMLTALTGDLVILPAVIHLLSGQKNQKPGPKGGFYGKKITH